MTKIAVHSDTRIRERIAAALADIEREHRVRILLAIESGSRAWGFPSSDSDWDVRFVYVRPLDAYLRVEPMPDVIEVPVTDELDLNGWDLRKALALLVGSNAVVLEWLVSPIVYQRDEEACTTLGGLAHSAGYLPALAYHYDRLARRHWSIGSDTKIRFKTLFYTLRPSLALSWINDRKTAPPMDMQSLLAGLSLPPALVEAIESLRTLKLAATEVDTIEVPPSVEACLTEVLSDPAPRAEGWDKTQLLSIANEIFFRMVVNRSGRDA